tara:strand:+ start:686 stop:1870 length:1185 start_codon:yes stop_codon:yes gene_type:complete
MIIKIKTKKNIFNIFLSKLILITILYFLIPINFAKSSQFSPAIKVNNVFISKYEINERRKLLIALGTSKSEARKNAKEHLINETLQQLHSKTIGVTVLPSQIEEVFNNFISVRSLTKNSLNQSLRKFGASLDELKKYLKANVLMRNIINNTFYSRMTIEDFDFSIFRPSASISIPTQLNISEIVIPFSVRGKENTIKLGERIIKDLKNGKDFEKLAKRFSKAATSKKGGLIGFIELDSLPDPLKEILIKLKSGKNSNVIITPNSIMIFKINSWKRTQKIQNPPNEITYAELNKDGSEINDCKSISKEKIIGPIKEIKLNKNIREALNQLRPSEKIQFVEKNGKTSLLILCDRRLILSDNSTKILQGQMLENRLQTLAEGLNLELKRTAEIIYFK